MSDFTLEAIGERMVEQSNRGTQHPLFAIQVDYKNYVGEGMDWEHKERRDLDFIDDKDLCEKCNNYLAENDELPEDCDNWACEDSFAYYNIEQKFDLECGVFFTQEACQKNINENSHRYNNPKSYVICAWRNPEMQAVMQELVKASGKELPSHYA